MQGHKLLRTILFVVDAVLALYIIAAPILPGITFRLQAKETTSFTKDGSGSVTGSTDTLALSSDLPDHNTLVVPEIGVDSPILEGGSIAVLDKGIWHRPKSSTPDKGGNTVLVAHRFLYTSGPNTFYNLDKLKVGQRFEVFWHEVRYLYEVSDVSVVWPNDASVEAQTQDPTMTLWSCTPLFIADRRLVVKAKLITQ